MGRNKCATYDYNVARIVNNRASPYDFENKPLAISNLVSYMLDRTMEMFTYEGLPDTISKRNLELLIQSCGYTCIARVHGKLYALEGGLGGEPDPYYMPTICTVANPALNISESFKINENCVIIPNDSLYMGLMPMLSRYATAITENELTLRIADINARLTDIMVTPTDTAKVNAERFLQRVADGKLGVMVDNPFLEGLKTMPYSSTGSNQLTNLIEYQQYLKASWFNELGLNANYNMKRESINAGESQLNNDALLPLCENMLNTRKEALEKVNTMFETNITVDFASSWKNNVEEIELAQEALDVSARAENELEAEPESEVNENES